MKFSCWIEWNWIKIYYNSMLKVISWYKIILNFGLVKAKWRVDFMNEMTFKPLPNQIHQSSFISLWEWEMKWKDWLNLKGFAAPAVLRMKRNENKILILFEWSGMNNEGWWGSEPLRNEQIKYLFVNGVNERSNPRSNRQIKRPSIKLNN